MARPKADKAALEEPLEKRLWISICGQESNQTTWRLARMNLAIRGIDASQVKWNTDGAFLNDAHKDLKVVLVIANPPFSVSDWSGELLRMDGRRKHGVPPMGTANFTWLQHFLHHLAPNGRVGVVLAKGSLTDEDEDINFAERFAALKAEFKALWRPSA